jgi:hypothetical protein
MDCDPLLMFDSENSVPAERPLVTSHHAERVTAQENNRRRFAGAFVVICVAVLAGYAAGFGTAARIPERQNSSPPVHSLQVTEDFTPSPAALPAVNQQAGNSEPENTPPPLDVSRRPAPANTPPASGLGALHVVSRPTGAQVYLDDRLVTTTPFRLYKVPSGSHTVRMELDGYQPWAASVDVIGGTVVRIAASLR